MALPVPHAREQRPAADLPRCAHGSRIGSYMHLLAAEDEVTWVSEYDGGSALEGPLSKQYLYSLYWALTTMSTVGYGDITPANDRERVFATLSLVVGALSFAFINGNVVGLLSTLDNHTAMVEGKLEAVKEYVQWRSLPKDLVIRIRRYYEHYYTRRAVFDEADILTQLNPQVRAACSAPAAMADAHGRTV